MGHSRSHACLRVGETSIAPNGFTPALTAPWAFVAADRFFNGTLRRLKCRPMSSRFAFRYYVFLISPPPYGCGGDARLGIFLIEISRAPLPIKSRTVPGSKARCKGRKGPCKERTTDHGSTIDYYSASLRHKRESRGGCVASSIRPQIRREYPLNLSISLSGGKETN